MMVTRVGFEPTKPKHKLMKLAHLTALESRHSFNIQFNYDKSKFIG